MARLELCRDELEEGLPAVCMRCGAPATVYVRKRFHWGPNWLYWVPEPFFLLLPFAARTLKIETPFCPRHRRHWFWRNVVHYGFGVILFAVWITALLLSPRQGQPRNDVAAGLLAAAFIGLVIWVFPAAILYVSGIKTTRITKEAIWLSKLSPEFVDAVISGRMLREKLDSASGEQGID